MKSIIVLTVLPLILVGCTSTNPKASLDEVRRTVAVRTGQPVPGMGEEAVNALLQSNLTAQSAVTITLMNNRSLQAEFEEIGISQAELAQAARLRNIEITGSWRFPDHPPSIMNAGYSAAGDFLDLLTLPARKKIATHALEQTKLRVANDVLRLAAEVQMMFYTVQADQELANRLAIIVEVNNAAADLAQRQYDAGNINDLDLGNQLASAAQGRLDLMQAQAHTRTERERLNRLLGLSGSQANWKVADELPRLPVTDATVENLESFAVGQRLDLAAARKQEESIVAALRLKEKTRFIPGVTVGVSTERSTDGQRVTGPSLTLELPLFDQGQPAVARLAAQYRQAQNNRLALETNIRSEVRQAQDTLLAARAAVDHYTRILLPQRQKILRDTLLHYNAMQKSGYDLLAAKEREQMAERGQIEAVRDYWMARAELERAVGGRLNGDGSPAPWRAEASSPVDIESQNHKP